MRMAKRRQRSYIAVNVKVPELLTDIIDQNLRQGKILKTKGFTGRAHFVETAVIEKMAELNLLAKQDIDDLKNRRQTKRFSK